MSKPLPVPCRPRGAWPLASKGWLFMIPTALLALAGYPMQFSGLSALVTRSEIGARSGVLA